MNLHQAIYAVYPNVAVIRDDIAYDADNNEISYDRTAIQAYIETNSYIEKRAAEYPPMADYLDGIVKGDKAQIDKYIADCLAVKAKYPKGEA